MVDPETIRVKPAHPSQGEWVVINKADFDSAAHELYEEAQPADNVPAKRKKRDEDRTA